MKHGLIALVLSVFFLSQSAAFAAEVAAAGTPVRKLQRGFLNVALSPFEISTELNKEIKNDTFPPSWFIGLGRGGMFMVGRAFVGACEIVTFPFPSEPVIQPEFAWQHFPETSEKKK